MLRLPWVAMAAVGVLQYGYVSLVPGLVARGWRVTDVLCCWLSGRSSRPIAICTGLLLGMNGAGRALAIRMADRAGHPPAGGRAPPQVISLTL